MRFRFVGDLDCPDWILAEIASLSKMSSIKFKLWCSGAVQQFIKGEEWPRERLEKLNSDGLLDAAALKRLLAALEFIFESAAKNDCSSDDLNGELQQLGLPAEHAQQLCKVYESNRSQLIDCLHRRSFKFPSWQITGHSIKTVAAPDGKQHKCALLDLSMSDGSKPLRLAVTAEKLKTMRAELHEALQLAQSYEANKT